MGLDPNLTKITMDLWDMKQKENKEKEVGKIRRGCLETEVKVITKCKHFSPCGLMLCELCELLILVISEFTCIEPENHHTPVLTLCPSVSL